MTKTTKCNCIESGYAQTTNYCPIHKRSSVKTTDWEMRFDYFRNSDGQEYGSELHASIKSFICKEIESARREGYEDGYRDGFDKKPRPLSDSAHKYQADLISTLRKEEEV